MTQLEQPKETKQRLREQFRQGRAARSEAERAAHATKIAHWEPPSGTRRIALYYGVGDEPATHKLITALSERGIEVLLPITLPDFSLDWALFSGEDDLVDARYGLREPAGARLGQDAIATADFVLVPATAVDAEGRRLGQGAGCYDRALRHVAADTPVWAIVYDDERIAEPLPEEPHDRRVDGVL